ncbi:calmodulin mutant SYNCAM35 [Conidiobolus coronatus NRRL 28638]|uniref:Calmodulin mutant SYNCAM35 n=1 Tax=Conidiobolus coronatus (strain ATCC 28846 / CBS 209.66 / NRRL 28638) TaxID=796925 RepID=A0A137PGF7_CONC2|nr:calmodulin mutant SYNCAM35 [Conidiobolus coronatus NRRL 28638]|eukprot:KXN74060.1 calmodulin mutant SYNCAM35 [Conidiobolus coronatus NRRL 28638]
MAALNDEHIAEIREAFSLFDKTGDGTIPTGSISELLRALCQNPTEAEIREILNGLPAGTSSVDFQTFLSILQRPGGFKPAGEVEEFVQAFQVFDKDNSGYISVGELRYVLTSLGDKLTEAEVDELLKGVEIGKDGAINYEEFVKMLINS